MKNFSNTIIALIVLFFVMQSCKKMLEEEPRSIISPGRFFTSPANYEQAVIGVYNSLGVVNNSNGMMMGEMFSDLYGPPSSTAEQALPTYQNNHQPYFYNVRGEWAGDYAIIKDANFVLDALSKSDLSEALNNAFSAEVRFLRAFAYFRLVQFYGDVPMLTKPITDYGKVQTPRSTQADIYKLILDDLSFAEANLPDQAAKQGRLYKLVATALLAKVYLTMAGNPMNQTQYFQNAKDKAMTVINSNRFQLLDDYAAVFHNLAYTSESIWEKQYRVADGGNGMINLTVTAPGFAAILVPGTEFANSFPSGDRRQLWGVVNNYMAPNGIALAPFFLKFVDTAIIKAGTTPSQVRNAYSFPILRFAEMYLIAAEAENEVNGPANAYQFINFIRKRARIDKSNPANVPDLSGLSKDQFRNAVLMERKWELHLEGSAWFDLKRTNTLNRIQTIRPGGLVHSIGAYNNTWYIPDNEITNNNIPQNPVYQ